MRLASRFTGPDIATAMNAATTSQVIGFLSSTIR